MRDIIEDGENGFLVDVGDVDGMISRLKKSAQDIDALHNVSNRAATSAREYSWRRLAEESVQFYCELQGEIRRQSATALSSGNV
jgi:glycosyltransferase involved in cell wall biosynthesis